MLVCGRSFRSWSSRCSTRSALRFRRRPTTTCGRTCSPGSTNTAPSLPSDLVTFFSSPFTHSSSRILPIGYSDRVQKKQLIRIGISNWERSLVPLHQELSQSKWFLNNGIDSVHEEIIDYIISVSFTRIINVKNLYNRRPGALWNELIFLHFSTDCSNCFPSKLFFHQILREIGHIAAHYNHDGIP